MSENNTIEAPVVDLSNAEVARVTLPEAFSARVNDALMFEQVLAQRACDRSGSASTKTRGLIRGGGKKPWRQKGTGRARAGSNRSPIWRGGGTIFGPTPRSYAYRLPRGARRAALASALAQKQRDGELKVVDSLTLDQPKTKELRVILDALGVAAGALIVTAALDDNVTLASRNLPRATALPVAGLNVQDILRYRNLVVTRDALAAIEERLAR